MKERPTVVAGLRIINFHPPARAATARCNVEYTGSSQTDPRSSTNNKRERRTHRNSRSSRTGQCSRDTDRRDPDRRTRNRRRSTTSRYGHDASRDANCHAASGIARLNPNGPCRDRESGPYRDPNGNSELSNAPALAADVGESRAVCRGIRAAAY